MANLKVRIAHLEGTLCAEVCTEGSDVNPYDNDLSWYVDAAWIENEKHEKVRDLTDAEIEDLDNDKNPVFTFGIGEALHDYEDNFDPTP